MELAIEARAWLVAGGVLAAGAAAWVSRWDGRGTARTGAGFAIVLAAITGWFALSPAATDLWRTAVVDAWTIESIGVAAASFASRVERLVGVLRQTEHASFALPAVAKLGSLAACAWIGLRRRDLVAAFASVYAAAMTAMAFIDMDGACDLYAYVGAGLLALFVATVCSGIAVPCRLGSDRGGAILGVGVVMAGVGWAATHRLATRTPEPFGITEQRELARRLLELVPPERVVAAGFSELHVLERRITPAPFVYFSMSAWRSLRRGEEKWRETAARLLAPAEIEAAIIGRSFSWDGEFRFAELATGSAPIFVIRTIALGPLCYTLLVKTTSPLAARLSDTTPCPP